MHTKYSFYTVNNSLYLNYTTVLDQKPKAKTNLNDVFKNKLKQKIIKHHTIFLLSSSALGIIFFFTAVIYSCPYLQ